MDYTDLNESLGAFEGAVSSTRARVLMPSAGIILLAVDGSSQDPTAIALAAEVAPRLRASICVTMGCSGEPGEHERSTVQRTVDQLKNQYGLDARVEFREGKSPAKQILAAKVALEAGIIVLAAPYLQELEELADESLGSTIDMILAESRVPILLVRDPLPNPTECFKRFVLPMTVYAPALAKAAGWAFCLSNRGAHIELYAVADKKAIDEAAKLAGDDGESEARSAEMLLRAEHKNAGGMISAMQKKAEETGIEVTVDIEAGDTVPLVLQQLQKAPCIAVMGAPLDRTSGEFHRVHDIALGSKCPLLIARE